MAGQFWMTGTFLSDERKTSKKGNIYGEVHINVPDKYSEQALVIVGCFGDVFEQIDHMQLTQGDPITVIGVIQGSNRGLRACRATSIFRTPSTTRRSRTTLSDETPF